MIVKRDFIYTPKGKNRPLHIYLPDDYASSGERYPVMYFFDGHNLFSDEDATYGKSWGLREFLDGWNKWVADVIAESGAAVKLRCQIGAGHCEADWERLVPDFMNFLWTE